MVLKLYYDLLSQPSRSLFIFLKKAEVPFESCLVKLGAGEQLKKEYLENVSRIPKVPVIHDDNFRLNESVAIVRYLSRQYAVDDQWYPKDSKKQAKSDEYLEWHHLNVRMYCSTYFITKFLIPLRTGKEPSEERVKRVKTDMEKSLKDFENYFLADSRFINGDKISYTDIHAACELEQTRICGYNPRDYFPRIKRWLDDVKNECNPYYDQAHKFINTMSENYEGPKAKL